FNAYQNNIYISTNYGISVFDLERLEFGDTYFIGDGGTQVQVSQTAILGDYIYASCIDGNGIRRALVDSPNLIDFQNWPLVTSGSWYAVEVFQDNLYATRTNNRLYQINEGAVIELSSYSTVPRGLKAVSGHLLVTTSNRV